MRNTEEKILDWVEAIHREIRGIEYDKALDELRHIREVIAADDRLIYERLASIRFDNWVIIILLGLILWRVW